MTHSTTATVHAAAVARITKAVARLRKKAASLGVAAPLVTAGPDYILDADPNDPENFGDGLLVADVTVTIPEPIVIPGYTIVAAVDFADGGNVVRSVIDAEIPNVEHLTPGDCDHCNLRRARKTTIVLEDAAGETFFIGRSCVRDFIGHDVDTLLSYHDVLAGIFDGKLAGDPDFADIERRMPLALFLMAASMLVSRFGYHKASSDNATKWDAITLAGYIRKGAHRKIEEMLGDAEPHHDLSPIAAAIWARSLEGGSEFDRNLKAVASANYIDDRHLGIAAYIPEGYRRASEKAAAKAAKLAERGNRTAISSDLFGKRSTFTGVIAATKVVESEWGTAYKMKLADDRGFEIWGTVPKVAKAFACGKSPDPDSNPNTCPGCVNSDGHKGFHLPLSPEVGDRIKFDAKLAPSKDDPGFGFYSRPTKGSLIEKAAKIAEEAA